MADVMCPSCIQMRWVDDRCREPNSMVLTFYGHLLLCSTSDTAGTVWATKQCNMSEELYTGNATTLSATATSCSASQQRLKVGLGQNGSPPDLWNLLHPWLVVTKCLSQLQSRLQPPLCSPAQNTEKCQFRL
jgi:hypothetical protein